MRTPFSLLLSLSVLLAACESTDAGSNPDKKRPPATDYLLVENDDGLVFYGDVPLVTIVEHDDGYPVIEIRAEAWDDAHTQLWYLFARIDDDDLLEGRAPNYLVLGTTAEVPGQANVMFQDDVTEEWGRAGKVTITWGDGWIDGEVVNDDPRLAATFTGGYRVSCSHLPRPGDPPVPAGGRIVDEAFESEFCSPFASVRPPVPDPEL